MKKVRERIYRSISFIERKRFSISSVPVLTESRRRQIFIYLLLIVVTALSVRALFLWKPFFGLEYEDAYIYTDVGRSINHDYQFSVSPFQTKSCIDGSVDECSSCVTYGGHFMIFPLIVGFVNKLVGYHIYNIFWLNAFISILVILVCGRIIKLILPHSSLAILITGLIISTVPFLTIFNTAGTSETFSSLVILSTVFLYLNSRASNFKSNWRTLLTIFFLSLACTIKRENLILLSIPYLDAIYSRFSDRKADILRQIVIAVISTAISIFIYFLVLKISSIEAEEGEAIASNTFALKYAFILLPVFLKSLLEIKYFGLIGYIVILSPLLFFFTKNVTIRILLTVSWLYLLLYSFHYRGYYFIKYERVSTFETLRYYTSFFPLIIISVTSFIFSKQWKLFENKKIIGVATSVMLLMNLIFCVQTRSRLSDIEQSERIDPVLKTLKIVKPADVILTDIPIIFRIFASEKQHIIDYNFLDRMADDKIDRLKDAQKVFILKNRYDDGDRYQESFKTINTDKTRVISEVSEAYVLEQIL